jgi:hypothetical protein
LQTALGGKKNPDSLRVPQLVFLPLFGSSMISDTGIYPKWAGKESPRPQKAGNRMLFSALLRVHTTAVGRRIGCWDKTPVLHKGGGKRNDGWPLGKS